MKKTIVIIIALYAATIHAKYLKDMQKNIVIDTTTALMWEDNSRPATQSLDWHTALLRCEELELGGFDDWRLPSYTELLSIVKTTEVVFTNIGDFRYWTSTTDASDVNRSWIIDKEDCYDFKYWIEECSTFSSFTNEKILDPDDGMSAEWVIDTKCVRN